MKVVVYDDDGEELGSTEFTKEEFKRLRVEPMGAILIFAKMNRMWEYTW